MIIEFKLYKNKEDIIDLGKSDEFENNVYQYRDVQFVHLEHLDKYIVCWTDEFITQTTKEVFKFKEGSSSLGSTFDEVKDEIDRVLLNIQTDKYNL